MAFRKLYFLFLCFFPSALCFLTVEQKSCSYEHIVTLRFFNEGPTDQNVALTIVATGMVYIISLTKLTLEFGTPLSVTLVYDEDNSWTNEIIFPNGSGVSLWKVENAIIRRNGDMFVLAVNREFAVTMHEDQPRKRPYVRIQSSYSTLPRSFPFTVYQCWAVPDIVNVTVMNTYCNVTSVTHV